MNLTSYIIAMACMGGLGAFFSIGLALAHFRLRVEVDPRLEMVNGILPGANCGGCGYPGCTAFAEALIHGKAVITGCPVNRQDEMDELSNILGVESHTKKKEYARVLCRGGNNETYPKGIYRGVQTCLAAHLTFGGDKLCRFGCLGFGDCITSCPFDAVYINENGLPNVNDSKCTGCGNCVTACPRNIIELHPADHNLFIFCRSEDEAKYTKLTCTKACNACKSCQKKAGEDNIAVVNNLARINYNNYGIVTSVPTNKCRNNAIELLQQPDNK